MAQTELFDRKNQRSLPLWLVIIAVALLAARIIALQVEKKKTAAADEKSLIQWVDIEEAQRRSTAENKPILYDFTAAWCGPCHRLEEEVFDDPSLARQINRGFIPVRVTDRRREDGTNSSSVQELQDRYRIRGFPTVIVADVGGAEQGRMEGFGGREAFESRIMERAR